MTRYPIATVKAGIAVAWPWPSRLRLMGYRTTTFRGWTRLRAADGLSTGWLIRILSRWALEVTWFPKGYDAAMKGAVPTWQP